MSLLARNASTTAEPISAKPDDHSSPWTRRLARVAGVTGAGLLWYFWPAGDSSKSASEPDCGDLYNKHSRVLVLDLDEYGIAEDSKLPPGPELKVRQTPYAVEGATRFV